jgi:CspA family cold shock protein
MTALDPATETGSVDRLDIYRGFGFIRPDGGGQLIFVHVSNVQGSWGKLVVGERVAYVRGHGLGGKRSKQQALQVARILSQ